MSLQTQDIIKRSATNRLTPAPRAREFQQEVAKLIDVTTCIGCKACQVACSEWNDLRAEIGHTVGVYDNPADLAPKAWTVMRYSEVEVNGRFEWLIRKDGCMHCSDPGCLKSCPSEGAIIQYANGIVDFQSEHCIGCGYCVAGCPFNIPRISKEDNRAYKCTLCVDRVAVGQEPACVKTCPTGAIHISEMVKFWKGAWKPISAAAFVATFAGLVFHYMAVGPIDVDEEDVEREKEFEQEARKAFLAKNAKTTSTIIEENRHE